MNKSDLFPALADINFAQKDPDSITREIINSYEAFSGRTLAPADPVRLFLDTIALVIIQQRNNFSRRSILPHPDPSLFLYL